MLRYAFPILFCIILLWSKETNKVEDVVFRLHSKTNITEVPITVLEKNLYIAVYNLGFIEKYWCKPEDPISKILYELLDIEGMELLDRCKKIFESINDVEARRYYKENVLKPNSYVFSQLILLYKGTHPVC